MQQENTKQELNEKIDSRKELLDKFKGTLHIHIFAVVELIEEALKRGNKILVFGNGGSAAQSSHFAAELVNRFYFERGGIPAVALTTDSAAITSIANDSHFRYVFSRQVEALGKTGDIALGITTSGRSANVIEALKLSKKMGLKTVVLCGKDPGSPESIGVDEVITVDSDDTPAIQEIHLFLLHTLAEILERRLFGGRER